MIAFTGASDDGVVFERDGELEEEFEGTKFRFLVGNGSHAVVVGLSYGDGIGRMWVAHVEQLSETMPCEWQVRIVFKGHETRVEIDGPSDLSAYVREADAWHPI